jgi:formylglycine-generating enzyme
MTGAEIKSAARGTVMLGAASLLAVALSPVALAEPSPRPDGEDEAAAAADRSPCPSDMVEVSGDYCPALEQPCRRWMPKEPHAPPRCAEFAPTGPCRSPIEKKHFCIDTFEFPNERGARPAVMKTFEQAEASCAALGKRLCGDREWTLACEGPARLPYPYGTKRDATACNIDKAREAVNSKAFKNPRTRAAEVKRLWQGEESGARAECVSPYGVFDMTGNVDEWVTNERGTPHKSGLKGGYWGRVRNRCRPMTTAHGERFAFYQTGFRCCADPSSAD